MVEWILFLSAWVLFPLLGIVGLAATLLGFGFAMGTSDEGRPLSICFVGAGLLFLALAWVVGTCWLGLPVTAWMLFLIGWVLFLVLDILGIAAAFIVFLGGYSLALDARDNNDPLLFCSVGAGVIVPALAWLAWVVAAYWLDLTGIEWILALIAWLLFMLPTIHGVATAFIGYCDLRETLNGRGAKNHLLVWSLGFGPIFLVLAWVVGSWWLGLPVTAWILSVIAWGFLVVLGFLGPAAAASWKLRSLVSHFSKANNAVISEDMASHLKRLLPSLAGKVGAASVEPLIVAIQSGPDSLRLPAAIALAILGDARAAAPLIEFAENDSDASNSLEKMLSRFADRLADNDLAAATCLRDQSYMRYRQQGTQAEGPGDWGLAYESVEDGEVHISFSDIRQMAEQEMNRRTSGKGRPGDGVH